MVPPGHCSPVSAPRPTLRVPRRDQRGQVVRRPSPAGSCLTPTAELPRRLRGPITPTGPPLLVCHRMDDSCGQINPFSPLAAARLLTITVAGGTHATAPSVPAVHLDIFRLLLLNQGNSWIAQDPVVQVPCLAQGHRILVEDSGARCESVALSSQSSPPFVSLRSIDEQPGTLNRLHDRLHPGLRKQERPAADKVSNKQRCRRGRTSAERVSEAVESVFLVFLEGSDRKCRTPPL